MLNKDEGDARMGGQTSEQSAEGFETAG